MRYRLIVVTCSLIVLAVVSAATSARTLTTLFSFDGTHGANPWGSLLLSGSTLYGMTFGGGTKNDGTAFSIPVGGGTPTTLFSFDGTHGEDPCGSLCSAAQPSMG